MKSRIKKITGVAAVMALAVTLGAGAYQGLGPQVTQANNAPEVSVSAGPAVEEGRLATFTLSLNPAPSEPMQVSVTMDDDGDFIPVANDRTFTVTVAPEGSPVRIPTGDDKLDEADGSISLTVNDGDGYTVSATDGSAAVAVLDNDAPAFENPAGSPRVFIGTSGVPFGEAEEAKLKIMPGSNGDEVHYARIFFAANASASNQACHESIGLYVNKVLWALYSDPTGDGSRQMKPLPGKSNLYGMWGPNHPVVKARFGNNPDCYANGGGIAVFLYNAEDELIHTWAPDLLPAKGFAKDDNGNVQFPYLCGDGTIDGETVRICTSDAQPEVGEDWENVSIDWHNPAPGDFHILFDSVLHFSNR